MPNPTKLLPADFFALRTPLLPLTTLLQWSADLQAPTVADQPGRLAAALNADRATLGQRLRALYAHPLIHEAIWVASPDLATGLTHWLAKPADDKGQRAQLALVRYLARMTGRATPFGLFSGCSLGLIEDKGIRGQGDKENSEDKRTRPQGDKEPVDGYKSPCHPVTL